MAVSKVPTFRWIRELARGVFELTEPPIKASMMGLAALALFTLVAGPAMSVVFVESSPLHAHVYLSMEAAQNYGFVGADHGDAADVGSVNGYSAASLSGPVDAVNIEAWSPVVSLSVFIQGPAAHMNYTDPDSHLPEQPPRYF